MADEIYSALNKNTFTKSQLMTMFNDGTGFAGAGLDSSGKNVGGKTASGCLHGAMAVTKSRFTDMLTDFADNVIPTWSGTAANGTAGLLTDSARSINVNAVGWEVDQTFIKGIIGAMCVDQIVNNYLDPCQLDSGTRRDDNTNGVLSGSKNYTDMEHKWDEAFGYFGAARDYLSYSDAQLAGKTPAEFSRDSNGDGKIDFKSEYNFGLSRNAGKRDKGASGTDLTKDIFQAFVAGRAIIAGEGDINQVAAQREIAAAGMEKVIAATVVHYINDTLADMSKLGTADENLKALN